MTTTTTTTTTKYKFRIGVGCDELKLGKTEKEISRFLKDEGEPSNSFDDVYFVDYKKHGMQISYNHHNNKAGAMFFYNNNHDGFGTFKGETLKGIGWNSTMEEVFKAYGKPVTHYKIGVGTTNKNFSRLLYEGADFSFLNGKMTRMSLTWEAIEEEEEIYLD